MVIEKYLDYLKKEDQNYTNTKCLYVSRNRLKLLTRLFDW